MSAASNGPEMIAESNCRVAVTGLGLVSPVGQTADELLAALLAGRSGVVSLAEIPPDVFPSRFEAVASGFIGDISEFGTLDKEQKKSIRKGLKLMCREIQMGVASAQRALNDAGLSRDDYQVDRRGVVFGADYMISNPQELSEAFDACRTEDGGFDYDQWGQLGLSKVAPLWLLKYLPNMPASHIAIYNDLRGPSNSITHREASSNLSIAEAFCAIARGSADMLVAGATGTRIHPARRVHIVTQEQVALEHKEPSSASRPFDLHRCGLVLGEGAGSVVLENRAMAEQRGARIYGEIVGYGSSTVVDRNGASHCDQAVVNAVRMAFRNSGTKADQIGHVHAHGLSTRRSDQEEAAAIQNAFVEREDPVPVVAAKSHFGNLGAGSGAVELIASIKAMQHGELFPILNYETPDIECPLAVVRPGQQVAAGDSVLNINFTPQGQASVLIVKREAEL